MPAFLAFTALVVGAVLTVTASTRIIWHDDPSNGVMIQWSSGFVFLLVAVALGWTLI